MQATSHLERFNLHQGDCLEVMRNMADNSVDSIVTDPPYELTSARPSGRSEATRGAVMGGFMGLKWDASGIAHNVEMWAECLRVLKPGGHMLAFSAPRTQHRMVCAIEDAGFEIRDQIQWIFGSGFPKSLDVSRAIDKAAGAEREVIGVAGKSGAVRNSMAGDFAGGEYMATAPATEAAQQWQGWGTALKPAFEPICVARKPLDKGNTVAANVLQFGTGAINIDGCRVGTGDDRTTGGASGSIAIWNESSDHCRLERPDGGRWPANIIHDGSDEVLAGFPDSSGSGAARKLNRGTRDGEGWGMADDPGELRDAGTGSAARFFYCAKTSKKDRNEGLTGMPEQQYSHDGRETPIDNAYQRNASASASANHHPTVKPTDLMAYLCRLVTPPGGLILDPFMGSGSTGKAAMIEGFRFIGIELDAGYIDIARARIQHASGITPTTAPVAANDAAVPATQEELLALLAA